MPPPLCNQRGQAVLMTALILIALLAMAGLAVDAGRFFIVRAQLAKAVDGGALAGARVLPSGQDNAQQAALGVAGMNFGLGFMNTTSRNFSTQFEESEDEAKVIVSGTAVLPTTLLRIVGVDQSIVTASAEAERRPLSIALVLDNSWSLDPEFT
ncbi:MAG TPA: pilus assembly protein TadG-related protein, partial [bacterium]|nr:pilus assembly protein TadG-related protein [bacterium]